jgi:hypothetical protein
MRGFAVHVIRIPKREEQVRALQAFLAVPTWWVRLPGDLYGLSDAHVKALEQAMPRIEFEFISKSSHNGRATPV